MRPRIVRMMWDVDAESTGAIMKDVGVSVLTSVKQTTDRSRTASSSFSAAESVQPRVNKLNTSEVSVILVLCCFPGLPCR